VVAKGKVWRAARRKPAGDFTFQRLWPSWMDHRRPYAAPLAPDLAALVVGRYLPRAPILPKALRITPL